MSDQHQNKYKYMVMLMRHGTWIYAKFSIHDSNDGTILPCVWYLYRLWTMALSKTQAKSTKLSTSSSGRVQVELEVLWLPIALRATVAVGVDPWMTTRLPGWRASEHFSLF